MQYLKSLISVIQSHSLWVTLYFYPEFLKKKKFTKLAFLKFVTYNKVFKRNSTLLFLKKALSQIKGRIQWIHCVKSEWVILLKKYLKIESRKFVVRVRLHWRPPEEIHFHWRGLKNAFYNLKLYAGWFTFHWRDSDVLPGGL